MVTEPTGKPRLLIAEDDQDFSDLLCAWLSPKFEVTTAHDGDTALTLAHRHPPDAILIDIMMPRLSGHGLLWALDRHPVISKARAIVITAHDRAAEALPVSRAKLLRKPFRRAELEELLEGLTRGDASPYSERRRAERSSLAVKVSILAADGSHDGRLSSLSLIGGFVDVPGGAPVPLGAEVRLQASLGEMPLSIPSRVVHLGTPERPGLGLAFHDMGLSTERHLLRALVELLEGAAT